MSNDTPEVPKKKGGLKKWLAIGLGAIVLVAGAAGGAIYASSAGLIGGVGHEEADPHKPQLVMREGAQGKAGSSKYQATYFEIEKNFTSNLVDVDGFMQVQLGVSTYYDGRVIENLKQHELPVRSAVLMTLADQSAIEISTPEGKRKLQRALKDTINRVLDERAGFGGVDDVYFTSFVIQ